MQSILISFIVPMYNSAMYIKKCLDSIECQGISKDNYEIIVVDDGSSDGGGEIVKSYDRVIYFYQENQGQSVARNKGIGLARGKYICFVDSDDMMVQNTLSYVLNVAINKDLDVAAYNMIRCTEAELGTVEIHHSNKLGNLKNGFEYIEKYNFNNGPCWYIVKKEILGDLRFEAGRYAEDGMFTMTMLMKAKRIIHVENQCYYYIIRPSSTTSRRDFAHVSKMVNDYYFAYSYMTDLIASNKSSLSPIGLDRCVSRSLTYIFFLMVRLLYLPLDFAKVWYQRLSMDGLIPISQPYPGLRYKLTTFVLNNSCLFYLLRFIIHNYYKIVPRRN